MKIVFMGTPALAVPCLDALALDHEIVAVVTQPDKIGGRGHELLSSAVKKRALELEIPLLQPERARDTAFIAELHAFSPDGIAVVAYGQILPAEILEMAPKGCVNLHYSLLPRWRGAAPVQYALWHGDKTTGVTTQHMASKLDAGDIIDQLEIEVLPLETAGELLERLTPIGADFLRQTFQKLENGAATRTPQDETQVTLCPQISREMAIIDWTKSATQIENLVRAMNPWPVATAQIGGAALKIWRSEAIEDVGEAGAVMALNSTDIVVGTGEGALRLIEVQAAGKAKMNAGDWARGARLKVGQSALGSE